MRDPLLHVGYAAKATACATWTTEAATDLRSGHPFSIPHSRVRHGVCLKGTRAIGARNNEVTFVAGFNAAATQCQRVLGATGLFERQSQARPPRAPILGMP